MAVHSTAFSGVTLTEEDAKKFERQVTYGRPKKEAKATVKRGEELNAKYHQGGRSYSFVLKAKA